MSNDFTEFCFLPLDHGPCTETLAKWYYDSREGVCKQFIYGGCQGNMNRYESEVECQQRCGNTQGESRQFFLNNQQLSIFFFVN